MHHSEPDNKYGENLFRGSALEWSDGRKEIQKLSSKQVVKDWGSEKADYDYASNTCEDGKLCGHYTQIVWRATTKVGCGVAVCEDTQEQVWVYQYQPAGNWVGKKPYQTLTATKKPSNCLLGFLKLIKTYFLKPN